MNADLSVQKLPITLTKDEHEKLSFFREARKNDFIKKYLFIDFQLVPVYKVNQR
jgi:hypothetical protein